MQNEQTNLEKKKKQWTFVDESGTFRLHDPQMTSYLYFPLVNEAGLMSSITPDGHGDIKTNQNSFLTTPVSVEDLHNSRSSRNFWCRLKSGHVWSVMGESAQQNLTRYQQDCSENTVLEAGFLWQKLIKTSTIVGLKAEVTSFVPVNGDLLEIMGIKLQNISSQTVQFTPTAAIPFFARSADNLRDHRHVTALLHRIFCMDQGILVKPTLSFDERGHQINETAYGIFAIQGDGELPIGYFSTVESFIGEGGRLDWPQAVVENSSPIFKTGDTMTGYEAMGAIRFADVLLNPGESVQFTVLMGIFPQGTEVDAVLPHYQTSQQVDGWLKTTQQAWEEKIKSLTFITSSSEQTNWLRWVTLQPILRRLFGNSFLPFHDYGRGGRGWRDLWQDALALLLIDDNDIGEMLFKYYAGVRLDGSNATIIGNQPGEFKADRNDIARVWMDHGLWPLFTTRLYLDRSGDLDFLLRDQTYFKDQHIHRAHKRDFKWALDQGQKQRTDSGVVYEGTILEHLLIQHLVPFFNVGEHNMIRLEGADWNDGMDMATKRGESVAFSAFYAGNLHYLSVLVRALEGRGVTTVQLAEPINILLDDIEEKIDYDSIGLKHERLTQYFETCAHVISGEKISLKTGDLAADLERKAAWLEGKIRTQEWIQQNDLGWFNGYYDDNGRRVEGVFDDRVLMTLTGQVFPLMNGISDSSQSELIQKSVRKYLWKENLGGPVLNTDFGSIRMDLGRCFGFAYGHKENGAMFTHMAVMYAYALYRAGFPREGFSVLDGIYRHVSDFDTARMFPGLPEYVEPSGRGVYPWLTGSASWYLFTLLTESFGVKGDLGDLVLEPKLTITQFDGEGYASVHTVFCGKNLNVVYTNPERMDCGDYQIIAVSINEQPHRLESSHKVKISKTILNSLDGSVQNKILVTLGNNGG